MSDIERRILDAVIKMVHVRKWTPGALFLNAEDHAEWLVARRGRDLSEVAGIPVKLGRYSKLYATHGWSGVAVPKRVDHRKSAA